MGYSTSTHVNRILANTLTTATSPIVNGEAVDLINFGTTLKTDLVPNDLVYQYISWADEEINAALSEQYAVPLIEKADVELTLLSDINEYNDTIEISKAMVLNPGDVIVFIDGSQEERHIVDSVVNNNTIELQDTLIGVYSAASTRVLRLKYPDPITLISARLAAANIYDKYFSAQSSPNETDFGKNLRASARNHLNDIRQGRNILHGQRRIGNRFYNSNLDDRYGLPKLDGDTARDSGETSR